MRHPRSFDARRRTEHRRAPAVIALAALLLTASAARAQNVRVTLFPTPTANSNPEQPFVADSNHVFYTEHASGNIARLNVNTGETQEWALGASTFPHYVQLRGHNALFTEQGNLSTQSGALGILNPSTNNVREWTIPNGSPRHSVLVGNVVYFTDSTNNSIGGLNLVTNVLTQWPIPTANVAPNGIAASADGTQLFFAEVNTGFIGRLSPATNTMMEWQPAGSTSVDHLHVVENDHVFFGSISADVIGLLDPDTGAVTEWSTPTPNQVIADVIARETEKEDNPDQGGFVMYFTEFPGTAVGKLNSLKQAGVTSTATVISNTLVTPTTSTITPSSRTLTVTTTTVTPTTTVVTGNVSGGFIEWPLPITDVGTPNINALVFLGNGIVFTDLGGQTVGVVKPE